MSNFDIKAHVQSMAPEAQDMLLEAAVKEHRIDFVVELMSIVGEKRDPRSVATKVSKWMDEHGWAAARNEQGTWSEFAEEGLNK